ncbi:hydroxyacylglutathione hydrolase [Paractinoplanes abujensis]|uniref:Putative NAD(P)/FAD-binding protein YdhS n=1 Tax=Paractinoplanes abujensis TaxID=882441 RepID=A0A7W7D0F8_9ACTN|nr:FAD/NAD(P)-binding protein [Actinoplanes abujensis]MBB4697906.1 putative NAD(P)/FAD-binding protein YdhS [Actinoplanes abujensis]GID19611.1 hydroxyacylglutathione hydrolase [Actinoplanes abujensis]
MTTVAVVGGGCAGVLATRELLSNTDDRVVLIEPDEPGGGLAYGSARPWHLLNSRAGAMSADPRDLGHFARWAGCSPDEFRPRAEYGQYLRDVFADTSDKSGTRLEVRRSRASGLTAAGVLLADGREVRAERVVVATGNPAPAQPAARPDHPDYIADPWAKGALEAIPSDVPVLLVGAGLTAIDVALTLTEGDRDAPITAVSRRGQLPLTHTEVAAPPVGLALDDCATLRDIVRAVRAEAARAGDWRAVVDGLRPYLDQLWTAFTPDEQDAFLRHLARPWECHRHRMAPAVGARVAALREEGRLEVRAGGVRSMIAPPAGGLLVELEAGVQWFGAVVNCAGPGRLPAAAGSFVGNLLDAGQARVGPHGLGLDIDASGRLIGADGRAQPDRWLIGPLRRGAKWETTAVPEIRAQAHNLAIPVG